MREGTPAPTLSRRRVLQAAAVVPCGAALLGLGPDAPIRPARFVIRGDGVFMEMSLPELLPRNDLDALASLDSGFATHVQYRLAVFAGRARRPFSVFTRESRVHRDAWRQTYVLVERERGKTTRRQIDTRSSVLGALTKLSIRIGDVSAFARGSGATYFVRVSALRNPIERDDEISGAEESGVFSQWVSLFVSERPRAEVVLELRSDRFFIPEDA